MKKTTIPDGVYPTMVTPFTEDLRVDDGALPPLLRWYEDHGAAGVFAICSSSEITCLRFEERLHILRILMRARRPGTVILASGHVETEPALFTREARGFAAEGIDAYVFISSRVVGPGADEDEFLRRLEAAAKALGDIPLGLYECPSPYRRPLTPSIIKRLPGIGNFAFSKDTCCNLDQIKAKLEAAQNTGLKLYNANTATLLESLRAGCAGFSGVMGNFHPQLYAKLCECYGEDPALAERLQDFCNMAFRMRQMHPVCAKYYLRLEGVPMGIASRAKDASLFTREQQLIIEHLRELTQQFEQEGAQS